MAISWILIISIGVVLSPWEVAGQLALIPQIITLLESINGTSNNMAATLPEMAVSLTDQEDFQDLTNVLLGQNTESITREIAAILPALEDYYNDETEQQQRNHNESQSTLQMQQRTLSQIAETQSQMANAFSEVAGILRRQSQQMETLTTTMESVVSVLSNISDTLPHVLSQQAAQTRLLEQQNTPPTRQPIQSTSTLYTPTATTAPTTTITSQMLTTVKDFTTTTEFIPRDCKDLAPDSPSGIYTITPANNVSFDVYCDMETGGGGWTVFQRRFDGDVDFYRGWNDYEQGFGSLFGEFWLGLSKIHLLTQTASTLRFDLEAFDSDTAYAEYVSFQVGNSASKYKLSIGSYTGTAPDSLWASKNRPFSTFDIDNTAYGTCAEHFSGAWWYGAQCPAYSNLNGQYLGDTGQSHNGMIWIFWKNWQSLKATEIKMRRED